MFYTLVQRFRGGSGLPGMDQVFLISRSKHGDIAGLKYRYLVVVPINAAVKRCRRISR
jgi:hypothetical protein